MNKYLRILIHIPCGIFKMCVNKLFHWKHFHGHMMCAISPLTEISLDRGGTLKIGKQLRMRDGAKLRVRKGGTCEIGKNVSISSNNIITCRDCILIGDNVQLSPNVMIYDHDHDYRVQGGVGAMIYRTSPISIGNNCWIGANTVILRGTKIGDNCVVGAGCVISGEYSRNSVIVQKRNTTTREIIKDMERIV